MIKVATCVALLGCTDKTVVGGDAKGQPAAAKADAKPDAKLDAKPDAKPDPHAGIAKPDAKANPHAGMAAAAAAAPKGPPREITPTGKRRTEQAEELAFEVPEEWETQKVASPMRKAQFVVPGPGGDAEMVVFRFAGGAGGVDANIARWKGQFKPPEGKGLDDITTKREFEAGGLKVTMIDITGHFAAPDMPGSTTIVDGADYRMLASIVEGSGDPFFFKMLGPAKTVDVWAASFEAGLKAAKKS
ncbi:MAG: hypothetical protein IAG13_38005 [Deltaproteobacteria bacterium]|nr:hypothetical protein [Nannocystaceae bacterium]